MAWFLECGVYGAVEVFELLALPEGVQALYQGPGSPSLVLASIWPYHASPGYGPRYLGHWFGTRGCLAGGDEPAPRGGLEEAQARREGQRLQSRRRRLPAGIFALPNPVVAVRRSMRAFRAPPSAKRRGAGASHHRSVIRRSKRCSFGRFR